MSTAVADSHPSTLPAVETSGDPPARTNRVLLIITAVAAIVPFYWAAIRDAHNGFYPTLDIAATVLRARSVFSSHPPMIGMWSSGSSWAGHEIHFPGAIQLYLLAIPVQLLGNTWGTLLAMATLNAFWVLLAGWLLYRRLGVNGALVGFFFLALFTWSIGSENLIDPRPMEMVTIPFLCFLFAVWAVASDDIDALPALAIVANFLFLDHLVLALQVPFIGVCALAGVILYVRRVRVPGSSWRHGDLRRLRRRLIQTGAITLIMWIPSLVQEIRGNPGNLTLLVQATGQHRSAVGSVTAGYNATIRLITDPMFWFRGEFNDPGYTSSIYELSMSAIVGGVVLALLIGGLGFCAWRRRDAISLSALAVSTVGILVGIETVVQAPAVWGFPLPYLRSLWGLAAFVWFAIGLSLYRLLRPRLQVRVASAAGVAAVVFFALSLSYANFGAAVDMDSSRLARRFVAESLPHLIDNDKVFVSSDPEFASQRYFSSLLLALDTAGVHYCVSHTGAEQFGAAHACGHEADANVHVSIGREPSGNGEVIAKVATVSEQEIRERDHAQRIALKWLSTHDEIELSESARRILQSQSASVKEGISAMFAPADGDLTDILENSMFRLAVGYANAATDDPPLFADPDIPLDAMQQYMAIQDRVDRLGSIWLVEGQ